MTIPFGMASGASQSSRAMNLALPEAEVRLRCDAKAVEVSAIEPLRSGGTHLVCTTLHGADEMRRSLRAHVIEGSVSRFSFHRARSSS